MSDMPALGLIVTHLNAPVGPILTVAHLQAVLNAGSLAAVAHEPPVITALLSSLFVEISPPLILRAMIEVGSDHQRLQRLYQETLALGLPAVPYWQAEALHDHQG